MAGTVHPTCVKRPTRGQLSLMIMMMLCVIAIISSGSTQEQGVHWGDSDICHIVFDFQVSGDMFIGGVVFDNCDTNVQSIMQRQLYNKME